MTMQRPTIKYNNDFLTSTSSLSPPGLNAGEEQNLRGGWRKDSKGFEQKREWLEKQSLKSQKRVMSQMSVEEKFQV